MFNNHLSQKEKALTCSICQYCGINILWYKYDPFEATSIMSPNSELGGDAHKINSRCLVQAGSGTPVNRTKGYPHRDKLKYSRIELPQKTNAGISTES